MSNKIKFTLHSNVHCRCTSRVHNPPECATPIQLCIGSWSSGIGSSDVMRTLHTSARLVSRQGTIVFDPRVPATPRVPLRCVRYYDAKIRFRSTKTLCRAGSGVAHSGGGGGGGYVLLCTCNIMIMIPSSLSRNWYTIRTRASVRMYMHTLSCVAKSAR